MQVYLAGVLHILNGVQLHYDSNVHRKVRCENDHSTDMILHVLFMYIATYKNI